MQYTNKDYIKEKLVNAYKASADDRAWMQRMK